MRTVKERLDHAQQILKFEPPEGDPLSGDVILARLDRLEAVVGWLALHEDPALLARWLERRERRR